MAETSTEIKVPVTLPVYTRVNGEEIELGTYSLTVPIKVEISTAASNRLASCGSPHAWTSLEHVPHDVIVRCPLGDVWKYDGGWRFEAYKNEWSRPVVCPDLKAGPFTFLRMAA